MADPQILQSTPSGYLVDYGDGNPVLVDPASVEQGGLGHPGTGLTDGYAEATGQMLPPAGPASMPAPEPVSPASYGQPVVPGGVPAPDGRAPMAPPGMPAPAVQQRSGSGSVSHSGYKQQIAPPGLQSYDEVLDAQAGGVAGARAAGDEAVRAAESAGDVAVAQAEDKYGAYDAQGNLVKPGAYRERAAAEEAKAKHVAELNAVKAEAIDAKIAGINQRIASIPAEDPGRIWSNAGAFGSALMMFGSIAGGMLAVTTGSGRNMALEAINQAIERDLQAQRAAVENIWKTVDLDRDELSRLREEYGEAEAERKIYMKEAVAHRFEAETNRYASAGAKAARAASVAALRADTEKDVAAAVDAYGKTVENKVQSEIEIYKKQQDAQFESKRLSLGWAAENRLQREADAKAREQKESIYLSRETGMYTRTKDPVTGKTVRAQYQPRNEAEKLKLDELGVGAVNTNNVLAAMETYLGTDPSTLSPDDRRRYAGLVAMYIQSTGQALGRMTEKDIELLKDAAGGEPLKFGQLLASKGVSTAVIQDARVSNELRYRTAAKQVNEAVDVELPEPDQVLIQRFGKQEPVYEHEVRKASLATQEAFTNPGKQGYVRKQEAVQSLVDSVTKQGASVTASDLQYLDQSIESLMLVAPKDRLVTAFDGATESKRDALAVLIELRKLAAQTPEIVRKAGGMIDVPKETAGVPLLRPYRAGEQASDEAARAAEAAGREYGGIR